MSFSTFTEKVNATECNQRRYIKTIPVGPLVTDSGKNNSFSKLIKTLLSKTFSSQQG